jgi:DNA-binding NarL/FixJ family response regulator
VEERWLKLALSYDFFDRLGLFTAHNDQKPTEFSQRLDQLSRVVGGSVADAPIEPSEAADEAAWASRLSSRELEVALLVARGLSNKEVARKLNVTDGTIKVHMHRIFKKSGTKSRYNLLLSKDASTLPEPEKVKDRPIKAQE